MEEPQIQTTFVGGSSAGSAADGFRKRDWAVLLERIARQNVIPIVGKDLLIIRPGPDQPAINLYRYVARRLVEILAEEVGESILARGPADNYSLNDAVCLCLREGESPSEIRHDILAILQEAPARQVPEPLQQLAEIIDFPLIVTTTFDRLLERAVGMAGGGVLRRSPKAYSFDPRPAQGRPAADIGAVEDYTGTEPAIYYLMGQLQDASSNVVLTEEDLLECVCALYSENKVRAPFNLLNQFARKDLLLLGCSFSDWLARFFLRAARQRRLSTGFSAGDEGDLMEYVVDEYTRDDKNLVLFLQQFRNRCRIYRGGDVIGFVRRLREEWGAKNEDRIATFGTVEVEEPDLEDKMADDIPEDGIFISYSHEDDQAVKRILRALKGFPVWYDRKKLSFADPWEKKIKENLHKCRFFMPVISKSTNRRQEAFFWEEWRIAAERTRQMPPDRKFILPVTIEEVDAGCARVPREFLDTQWQPLPKGEVSNSFVQHLRQILETTV